MSCLKDTNKAILDDIFTKYIDNRPSYKRIGLDTIEINQTFKNKGANPTFAARQILQSKLKQIAQEYNGHVSAVINQTDAYSPISATLRINPNYVQHVFDTQVQSQDKLEQGSLFSTNTINDNYNEQNRVNNNSGLDNNTGLENEEYDNPTVGTFANFIQNKENILADYFKRLKETERQLDIELEKPVKDTKKLAELNSKKRKLKNNIYGIREDNKEGLKDEIARLKNSANSLAIGYDVEKDMQRLEALSRSNDLQELNEAKNIVEFYRLGGTFVFSPEPNNPEGAWRNPFFSKEDVYITDDRGKATNHFKISNEDIAVFQKWANRAINIGIVIDQKKEDALEKIVNEDSGKIKTFGDKQFNIEELTDTSDLKDTHWIDMWTMDITKNIVNKDSILPQIAFSQLQNATFNVATYALKFAHETEKQSPKVLIKLKELGITLRKAGIEGMNQGSFSVFLERTKDGLLTGNYATKYSKEFIDDKNEVEENFDNELNEAYQIKDAIDRNSAIKSAFKRKRDWYRKNTGIVQFNKIPEIISDNEFASWDKFFDKDGSEHYKKQLIGVIGEKEYNKQIEQQKKLLRGYESDKQDLIDTLMEKQGIDNFDDLSETNKKVLDIWKVRNSPFYGIDNHYDINFREGQENGNYQKYNLFVPRRNETRTVKDPNNNKRYIFLETQNKTVKNYYNSDYEKYIEPDEDLFKFHNLIEESMDFVKRHASPEIAEQMAVNHLSALAKTSAEIVTSNYEQHTWLQRISPAFAKFWEDIRLSFGVKKQSELFFGTKDSVTGETNYKVNDNFLRGNFRAINDRRTIEEARFLQTINTDNNKLSRNITTNDLKRGIRLDDLNPAGLILLSKYLGMNSVDINTIQNRLDNGNIHIFNIIKDYATHETVKENSFDLPKLIKYFTYQAAYYSAKSEALPRLTLIKNFYNNLTDIKKNNLGTPIFNVSKGKNEIKGLRSNANKRFEEHWNRVILGNVGKEHKAPFSIGKKDGLVGETIYSKEDRKKLNEINELLGDETRTIKELEQSIIDLENKMDEDSARLLNKDPNYIKNYKADINQKIKLIKIKEGLGKVRTTTALFDSLMNWIRFQKLGWNINSGVTNAVEGWMSNMIIGANGEHFTPNNIYKAYGLIYHSVLKNISFGKAETGVAKKIRILSDRFDYLDDQANELQRSSTKTFSDKAEWLKAMTLTKRVEFMNQGVVMLATLLDQKVTSTTTGQSTNVFDAMDSNGKLLPEYRTQENIDTWENNTGDKFLEYKKNLKNAIELGHGNYDVLKGMLAKSTTAGKALMMFKTWLPMQLYWRFATEQADLQSGSIGFKGKYWSYGIGSGAFHGGALGLAFAGPIGAAIGGLAGGIVGAYANNRAGRSQDITDVIQESITSALMLIKKMIGMPLNTITSVFGRTFIETNKGNKVGNKLFDFDSQISKDGFTKQDAMALNSNMSDIAIQLILVTLMLIVKGMFWDDDDEKDDPERLAHNLMINKLMQLNNQAGSYTNIVSKDNVINNTVSSIGVLSYLADVGKVAIDIQKLLQGKDTIKGGVDAGDSRLVNQMSKTFVPGLFKGLVGSTLRGEIPKLGVESQMQNQFQPSPFDDMFKLHIPDKRKELRNELEAKGTKGSKINKKLTDVLPTKTFLHKIGVNRSKWNTMDETSKENILQELKNINKEKRIKKEQDRLQLEQQNMPQ